MDGRPKWFFQGKGYLLCDGLIIINAIQTTTTAKDGSRYEYVPVFSRFLKYVQFKLLSSLSN